MSRVNLAELRRLHEAANRPDCTGTEYNYFTRNVLDALPALLDELEAAREELRRLTQANGDLRKERDRAVAEAQRQDSVANGLRRQLDGFKPVGGDFIKAAKAIGAAEELELVAGEWSKRGRQRRFHAQELLERSAQLRQEAEGK